MRPSQRCMASLTAFNNLTTLAGVCVSGIAMSGLRSVSRYPITLTAGAHVRPDYDTRGAR